MNKYTSIRIKIQTKKKLNQIRKQLMLNNNLIHITDDELINQLLQ